MTNIELVQSIIYKEKLFVVVRDENEKRAEESVYSLLEVGIKLIEISLLTKNAFQLIEKLSKKNIFAGVGTAMDLDMVKKSIDCGAKFIISPHFDPEIVQYSIQNDILVSSGAVTPTEIVNAKNAGTHLIKVFPAHGFGGTSYLKSLIEVFPDFDFMPTGGVNESNIKQYFDIGVKAVGVSGAILDKNLLEENRFKEIQERAKKLIEQLD